MYLAKTENIAGKSPKLKGCFSLTENVLFSKC